MAKLKPLPKRAEIMGEKLGGMVLATTRQLRSGTDLSEDQAKRAMQDLREREFVSSVSFGCLLPKVDHFVLTPEGLKYFGVSEEQGSWHTVNAVGALLINDPLKVEAVNEIATLCVSDGWKLEGVQWLKGQKPAPAMDAVAVYRHPDHDSPTYRVFCLPSLMNNQWELYAMLQQLPESLRAQALDPTWGGSPWELCIVEADEWGAARSLTMAETLLFGWISSGRIKAWYYDGEGWRVSDGLSAITGSTPTALIPFANPVEGTTTSLRPVANERSIGGRYFDRIFKDSIWATGRGRTLFHVLRVLCDYPVVSAPHLTALAGEARKGKETPARLAELVELGLAKMEISQVRTSPRLMVSRRGQGAPRFGSTAAGRRYLWLAWRCRPKALYTRSEHNLLDEGRWSFRHQDAAYEVLSQFRESGWPVAPGWRAHARLANSQTIEPDGMVRARTRWDTSWCFLEVELSDTSVMAFKPRCKKYGAAERLVLQPHYTIR